MVIVSVIFWALVAMQQLLFMAKRGALFSPREHWRAFKFLWLTPGTLRALVGPYLSYFRPGFHPADRGGLELVEEWKRSVAA
jgi:predicted metal-dependent hydrolase